MGEPKAIPAPLPQGVVGGKRSVYEALIALATEQADQADLPFGDAYFRKAELAERAGLSISRITPILRWLVSHDYIAYQPGDPGVLSQVTFLPEEEG